MFRRYSELLPRYLVLGVGTIASYVHLSGHGNALCSQDIYILDNSDIIIVAYIGNNNTFSFRDLASFLLRTRKPV